MSNRVMVFIDYQNIATTAIECFPRTAALRRFTHIDPVRLAERIVDRRRFPSELSWIRIYRGRPEPHRQPGLAAASDLQTAAWHRDPRVTVVRRPLRYPRGFPVERPQEKGVDVALAVDFVRFAYEGAYDVGIIASHDTDLLPALEAVRDLGSVHLEVSGWARRNRLWFPGTKLPWSHDLGEADYRAVCDDTDYLKER